MVVGLQFLFCALLNLVILTKGSNRPLSRSHVPNIANQAVQLGQLYDGSRDQLIGSMNIYKQKTIQDHSFESQSNFIKWSYFLGRVSLIKNVVLKHYKPYGT